MLHFKKSLCILMLILTSASANAYVDLVYHNQSEIDALKAEIDALNGDSLAVRKMVDWVSLFADGDGKKTGVLQEGINMAKRLGMKEEMGIFYSDMAWMYFYRDDKEKAIEYFKKTIEYCKDTELLVNAYGCLSNTCSWDGKHEEALKYAQTGLKIAREKGNKANIADAFMFLGDVYKHMEDKEKSKQCYFLAITNLDQEEDYFSVLRLLANVYDGDTSLIVPYNFFSYARVLKYQYEKASPRKRQLIVYNILKATQTFVSTTEKEELKSIQLENQRKTTLFFAIFLILLASMAGMLIYQVNVKRKANKKLEEANEIKSRLFVILNHDLRKPIASMMSYLELKSSMPDALSKEEQKILEEDISEATNQLYVDMENLLLWAKDQMQSFEPNIRNISVSAIFDDIRKFFVYEKRIPVIYEIDDKLCLKTDENYLKTIIRNLTLNAIEASLSVKKPVVWRSRKEYNKTILSIENQGPPIDQEKIDLLYSKNIHSMPSRGTGLIIVRNLAESINCKIEVERGKEYGTTFHLIFKS